MYTFHPNNLTPEENYKLVTGAIIPRPIAFITTLSKGKVVNAAPFSYFNAITHDPPLLSIAIHRQGGKMKDTAKNIIENGELVIHLADEFIISEMDKTAHPLPSNQSELDLTTLNQIPSQVIRVPGIKEARVRFECKLERHVPIQDSEGGTSVDFLIVKIVCYHFQQSVYASNNGHVLLENLHPVSRLAGNFYGKIGKQFTV
jgi:flavin reductase (DIM6/NTAB) family NADH-FMN oxidoreductase RutF